MRIRNRMKHKLKGDNMKNQSDVTTVVNYINSLHIKILKLSKELQECRAEQYKDSNYNNKNTN